MPGFSRETGDVCVVTSVVPMTGDTSATVLVVDDEPNVADLFATWLAMEHDVRTAYSGEAALERVGEDVDVVFLDRQMPGRSGDEVLARIRDRGIDTRVVLVTAVDPDFDIIEKPFDEYLTKPISGEDLLETTQAMVELNDYDETLQEYFALASKQATLEAEKTSANLLDNPRYQEMTERVAEVEQAAESVASDVDEGASALFQQLSSGE